MVTVKKEKILILGAGIAGLTAAYYLKRHFQVTVLEARDRVGGRIDTRTIDDKPPLTIEMGGEWIGNSHKRMKKLCHENNLHLINHRLQTSLLYNGKYYSPRQWKFSKKWQQTLKELIKKFSHFTHDDIEQLDGIDWWHFLVANHIPQKDIEILDLIDGTDYGEDIRFVSAYNALSDYAAGLNDAMICQYRIVGGNTRLPQALAKKIGHEEIHCNHVVEKIEQKNNEISVTCDNGKVFQANVVICTLPAYALSQIHWDPKLPEEKQEAVASLGYARIMKTSLLFSKRFWKEDFEIATDTLADFVYHSTQNQSSDKGVLTSYAVGDRAVVLAQLSDKEKIDEICRGLKIPFGDISENVEKVESYYWGDDPYTKGAYALFEKNHPIELKQTLRQSFGNVYFAGEHTADCQGFMEGAAESAERAVEAVLTDMQQGYYRSHFSEFLRQQKH